MLISNPQTSNYMLSLCGTVKAINIKKSHLNMLQVILHILRYFNSLITKVNYSFP